MRTQRIARRFHIALLMGVVLLGAAPAAIAAGIATLDQVQGEVQILRAGAAEDAWVAVKGTVDVQNGDQIQTQNGTCILKYGDQAGFELAANTRITAKEEPDRQDVWLRVGSLKGTVDGKKSPKLFQVVTPTAVAAIRGTQLTITQAADGTLTITLDTGEVLVYNDSIDLELTLASGQTVQIKYDKVANTLEVTNSGGTEPIAFDVQGDLLTETSYTVDPGKTVVVNLSTAGDEDTIPETETDPNEGAETVPNEGAVPPSPISE